MKFFCLIIILFTSSYVYSDDTKENSQLTDYEKFISYPYIEKAYRLQRRGDYEGALVEALYAIERAPRYQPYKQLAQDLALSLKDLDTILSLIASEIFNQTILEIWLEMVFQLDNSDLLLSYIQKLNLQISLNNTQKLSIISRAIERLVGLNAFDSAILLFNSHNAQVNFNPQIVEMIMFALLEQGDVKGALLHISLYSDINSTVIDNTYIELLLKSNKGKEEIFNEFTNLADTELTVKAIRAWTQQRISDSNLMLAISGLDWLNKNALLTRIEQLQYLTLLNESENSYALQLVQLDVFSCNQKIDTYLKFDAVQNAKELLIDCLKNERYLYNWLEYASSLLSANEMLALKLYDQEVIARLNRLAIERYIAQNNNTELLNNLSGKQDIWSLGILLEVYQSTSNWAKAAQIAEQIFNLTGNIQYLDIATYLYVKSENTDIAKIRLIANLPFNGELKRVLTSRLLSVVSPSDLIIDNRLFNYIVEYEDDSFTSAQLIRKSLQCEKAIDFITNKPTQALHHHRILTVCYTASGNADSALLSINKLELTDDSYQLKYMKLNVLYSLKQYDDALSLLESIPVQNRNENWQFQQALLFYELENYDAAIAMLDSKKVLDEKDNDLYINSLIAKGSYKEALELTSKQSIEQSDLDSNKWLRQANLYQALGQKQGYIEALTVSIEKDPANFNAQLSLAYALVEESPQQALDIFEELEESSGLLSPEQYEQMAYLSQRLQQNENTNQYLKQLFDASKTARLKTNKDWALRRLYENTEKFWEVTLSASHASGAIMGDVFFINENSEVSDTLPTNNLSLRTEYFFNSINSGASVYSQFSTNGTDEDIFKNTAIELGVTYKPFDDINFKLATGALKFVDNSSSVDGFIKLFGDAFSRHNLRRDWRADSSWYERLFYYDYTYFYNSKQSIGQAFFDFGKTHNISQSAYRTLKYYGSVRYDYRKIDSLSVNGKNEFDEVSLGLGVQLDEYFVRDTYDDVLDRLSVKVEARFNLTGNLSQDSSGLVVNVTYEY